MRYRPHRLHGLFGPALADPHTHARLTGRVRLMMVTMTNADVHALCRGKDHYRGCLRPG